MTYSNSPAFKITIPGLLLHWAVEITTVNLTVNKNYSFWTTSENADVRRIG